MYKFLKPTLIFLFLLGISQLQAQTKIWGHGATYGEADGEFQNNFVQSTTASNYSPTQWTALSISENNGSVMPGAAFWTRTTTGLSRGAYASNMTPASSATAANGVAIFDSDYMDNGGRVDSFGTGTSVAGHHGELISPIIDLTGFKDSALVLSFYSYNRFIRAFDLSVSMSVDNGTTWVKVGDLASLQTGVRNVTQEDAITILLTTITNGVTDLSQCRLKFTFNGMYYYFIVDDITISTAPKYDMEIGIPDFNASEPFAMGDIIRMGGSYTESYLNIDFDNPIGWSWGAKTVNKGYANILPAARPRLICKVDAVDLATGTTTYAVFRDTAISTDTIFSDFPNGTAIHKDMTAADLDFIRNQSPSTKVSYVVSYWVEHDSADGGSVNDTIQYNFVIDYPTLNATNNRYEHQYTSKARVSPSDGRVYANGANFPGRGPHTSFEYGTLYYFPTGLADGITIDSIDLRYRVPPVFTGASTQTLVANVYRFQDGTNGGTADGYINGDELSLIGLSYLELNNLGTANGTATGEYGLATFEAPIDASSGGTMINLADGGFYYISVQINPSLTGGASTFSVHDVPWHGVDDMNYAMNFGKTSTDAPFGASAMRVIDANGAESWFQAFRGFRETPAIGIFFSSNRTNATRKVVATLEGSLNLSPNPATSSLKIDLQLEANKDVQYIVTDVTGRVVYYDQHNSVQQDVFTIDISTLPKGVYIVSTQTKEGVLTKRFVKQ